MAALASNVGVFTLEWEVGVFVVIKAGSAPARGVVAVVTGFTVAAVVTVIIFMATDTGFGGGFVVDRVGMAALTTDILMRARQFEVGIFVVIEAALIPAIGGMTVFTLIAAATGMGVVYQMAADAAC